MGVLKRDRVQKARNEFEWSLNLKPISIHIGKKNCIMLTNN